MKNPVTFDNFLEFVNKAGPDECWNWTRPLDQGQARARINRRRINANRVAYAIANGLGVTDLPRLRIFMKCGNKGCCNPAHCFLEEFEARFWAKVDKRGPDECWPWKGAVDSHGYGQMVVKNKRKSPAHRIAFAIHNKIDVFSLSSEMDACHHCDNPPCCNPNHLFLGTAKDNFNDCRTKGRIYRPPYQTHAAKLSSDQVIEIRSRYSAGNMTYAMLASAFMVHEGSIGKIIRRESWYHI